MMLVLILLPSLPTLDLGGGGGSSHLITSRVWPSWWHVLSLLLEWIIAIPRKEERVKR
jgi:hypothetical protein